MHLLAHASGLIAEGLDIDIGPSPFRLHLLLSVRANAYAMCGSGRLALWNAYTDSFCDSADLCAKAYQSTQTSFEERGRRPQPLEAEVE